MNVLVIICLVIFSFITLKAISAAILSEIEGSECKKWSMVLESLAWALSIVIISLWCFIKLVWG